MHETQAEMPFPLTITKRAPLELKLRVLSAVDKVNAEGREGALGH